VRLAPVASLSEGVTLPWLAYSRAGCPG